MYSIVPSCYLFSPQIGPVNQNTIRNHFLLNDACILSDHLGHLTKIKLLTLKCLILKFLYCKH